MLQETLASYREALRWWIPLWIAHLFVRLISAALLVPLIGAVLAIAVSTSDQAALTDQDIARFLLTPFGIIGALIVGSFVLVAAVFDLAFMTALFRSGERSVWRGLQSATALVFSAFPRLLLFAGEALLRVLLLSAPFLVVAAIPAALLLREFDINYYLATRPTSFTIAVGFAGLCIALLALTLFERLSAWALALHYAVFDRLPATDAFRVSRRKMTGHRVSLAARLLVWAAIRIACGAILLSVTGFLLAEVPQLLGANLRAVFLVIGFVMMAWIILNSTLNALANGALADLFNDEFDRSLEARPARVAVVAPLRKTLLGILPTALVVSAVISLYLGTSAANSIGTASDVEVIGHRGAAESRPENTMASVLKALEDGADWVEIDVQESADGEVIVVHDSDFMKSAGVPTKVWDVTTEELAEIDIGSWFDSAYADQRTPTLRDVLSAVKDRSRLIIELKYYGHDVDLENRVIALVEEAGMEDQIATMSLKYTAVQEMLALRPDWRAGVLAATSIGDLSALEGDFLAVSAARVSPQLVTQAAVAGKDLYVWTVNDPVEMSRMISLGVSGIITDAPARARQVIAHQAELDTVERMLLRIGNRIGYSFDLTPPNTSAVP